MKKLVAYLLAVVMVVSMLPLASISAFAALPKLDTPTNVTISDGDITWDSVENAETYQVYAYLVDSSIPVVGTLIEETSVSINSMKDVYEFVEGTSYKFSVQALGDGVNYRNSSVAYTDEYKYSNKVYWDITTGVIEGEGNITASARVEGGTDFEITVTPATGYILSPVQAFDVNGIFYELNNNKYTIKNIDSNKVVSVRFKKCPHKWNEGKVIKPATNKVIGEKLYTCVDCGTQQTVSIPKLYSIKLAQTSFVYNATQRTPAVTVKDTNGDVVSPANYTVSYTNNKAVGTGSAVIKFKGDYDYTSTKTFTITPQAITEANVTLSYTSTTYTASAKEPVVTVRNSAGTKLGSKYYTVEYKDNVVAGTATVAVTLQENYSGVIEKTFTIKPQAIKEENVTLSATSYVYDATEKKPTVTVRNSAGTKLGSKYYTVEYTDNKAAGTATATITMQGNYSGTIKKTFTITPQPVVASNVTLSSTAVRYDGTAQKPTLTVKNSAGTKLGSKYYTVTYTNNINVGKATVKVVMKGNYSGTFTKTFTIKPAPTTLDVLTATTGGFKATWTKQIAEVTSYQLQYATKSDFSDAKTYTFSANTTVSKSVTGLESGTKYYVRVRTYKTVDTTKYYSIWSDVKTVTAK